MKRYALFLFVILCALQACARRVRYGDAEFLYNDENGSSVYQVRCKKDSGECYKGAGTICSAGFEIVDWLGYNAYGPVSVAKKRKDLSQTELVKKSGGKYMTGGGSMMFKCKNNGDKN